MMKNKFFKVELPVIALAVGMMVIGCDDGSTVENTTHFSETIRIIDLPNEDNGKPFTLSIIDRGKTMVSESGTIVDNAAEAQFQDLRSSAGERLGPGGGGFLWTP